MNKLEQQTDLLVKKLAGIDWDEQEESFRHTPGYNHETNTIVLQFVEASIEYDFANYIYEFPREIEEPEYTEGFYLLRPYCDPILRTMSKLLDRISSHEAKIKLVDNMEKKLRDVIMLGLRAVPIKFEKYKRDLLFTIIGEFDEKFREIKLYGELVILMKQNAVLNNYPVFKWNASQADLFRYIQLGIDLELLEDNRSVIGDFLGKYVVCYNAGAKQFDAISPRELKSTFYRSSRHQANEKFLRKLIAKIKSKFPEFLPD